MKASDKIYFPEYCNVTFTIKKDGDVEYIRKDALLEWAKEEKKQTEEVIKQHSDDESLWAEMHWYERLIDKLNQM